MAEQTFFEYEDVKVTNARFIGSSQTCAISNLIIEPVVAAEYGFDDVPQPFEDLARHLAHGAFGKVVMRL